MALPESVRVLPPQEAAHAHFQHALSFPGDTRYLQQLQRAHKEAVPNDELYLGLAGYWFANILLLPPIDNAYGQNRLQETLEYVTNIRIDEKSEEDPFTAFALEFGRLIATINEANPHPNT